MQIRQITSPKAWSLLAGGVVLISSSLVLGSPPAANAATLSSSRGASPQMIVCGYGNCQPTTWTREVPVQIFAPTPSGTETVWVNEIITTANSVSGTLVTGCGWGVASFVGLTIVTRGESAALNLGGDEVILSCVSGGITDAARSVLTWLGF